MLRSFLFVPGNSKKMLSKALASEAGAIIIDLEDAISNDEKANAREQIQGYFFGEYSDKPVYLRVNGMHSGFLEDDLQLANHLPIRGIVLPKTDSAASVTDVSKRLNSNLELIPLIESARGLHFSFEIAEIPSVVQLAFGAVDFCLEMGIPQENNISELNYPRAQIAISSRAAGIRPPIDSVYTNIHDPKGLAKETKVSKQMGFGGKLIIHPTQIQIVNDCFQATDEEVDKARKIVRAFERAQKSGIGVIELDGKMIDFPVYKQAKNIIQKT